MANKVTTVGDRVKLMKNDNVGKVRFIGQIPGKKDSIFYGVELDEAKGKNNGCVKSIQYFTCAKKKGIFVKAEGIAKTNTKNNKHVPRVTVGDVVKCTKQKCSGTIRYIGTPYSFKKTGVWYGIELNKAKGNNNGTVKNRWYFVCKNNYGIFLKDDGFTVPKKGRKSKKKSINLKEPASPSSPQSVASEVESPAPPEDKDKDKGKIAEKKEEEKEKEQAINCNVNGQTLKVITWNVAGINNNPWEYYVFLKDENYNALMTNIETFLTETGKDVKVSDVLESIDSDFLTKLQTLLGDKCSNFEELIEKDVKEYLSLSIPDFLSNKSIGEYRLISWPDRLLNTIDNKNNTYLYRPSVINYYQKKFKDAKDWFDLWLSFMKETGIPILETNVDNKYAQKFGRENLSIFLFLNVILLGIFDAILVFMLFDIETKKGINWQKIKNNLYEFFNKNKLQNTIKILNDQYADYDILCLQEVRNNLLEVLDSNAVFKAFGQNYHLIFPSKMSKNNQTSIICLKKDKFDRDKVKEITDEFVAKYDGKVGIGNGDLLVIRVNDYVLISFHGDSGGMATGDLIKCVDAVCKESYKECKLIIGIDANTHYDHASDGKKKYSVNVFNELLKTMNMNTCFDGKLPPHYTVNSARTYLQPQLNKAVKKEDIIKDGVDFRAPKDFILFGKDGIELVEKETKVDNTGIGEYDSDIDHVMPTQDFPSDHAIVSAVLHIL